MASKMFEPINKLIEINNQDKSENQKKIADCIHRMVFTVHNFHEISKIRRNSFVTNPKNIIISHTLEKIFGFFHDDLVKNSVDLQIKIQDILNTHVIEVDELRLGIILYNLISNSVKFTDMGRISVSAKILDRV